MRTHLPVRFPELSEKGNKKAEGSTRNGSSSFSLAEPQRKGNTTPAPRKRSVGSVGSGNIGDMSLCRGPSPVKWQDLGNT